jgi:hypothetical protein
MEWRPGFALALDSTERIPRHFRVYTFSQPHRFRSTSGHPAPISCEIAALDRRDHTRKDVIATSLAVDLTAKRSERTRFV